MTSHAIVSVCWVGSTTIKHSLVLVLWIWCSEFVLSVTWIIEWITLHILFLKILIKMGRKLKFMTLRYCGIAGYGSVPGSVLNARDTVLTKQSKSWSLGSFLTHWEKHTNKHKVTCRQMCITIIWHNDSCSWRTTQVFSSWSLSWALKDEEINQTKRETHPAVREGTLQAQGLVQNEAAEVRRTW